MINRRGFFKAITGAIGAVGVGGIGARTPELSALPVNAIRASEGQNPIPEALVNRWMPCINDTVIATGTSGACEPLFSRNNGVTVLDGSVMWTCVKEEN